MEPDAQRARVISCPERHLLPFCARSVSYPRQWKSHVDTPVPCTSRRSCTRQLHNSRSILQGRLVVAVAILVARVSIHPAKVWMDDRLLRRDAASGVVDEQGVEQIEAYFVERGDNVGNVSPGPFGEGRLEVRE